MIIKYFIAGIFGVISAIFALRLLIILNIDANRYFEAIYMLFFLGIPLVLVSFPKSRLKALVNCLYLISFLSILMPVFSFISTGGKIFEGHVQIAPTTLDYLFIGGLLSVITLVIALIIDLKTRNKI